jgi:hypothetical protein
MADPYELIKKPMGGPPEQPSGGAPGSMDSLGLPGYLSFDQWSKPSQAKWFKKSKGPNQTAESVYQQWLQMLQQRAAAPAPATAPPPGGGRGRNGGPPGGASAPPPGGKPQGGRGGNQASLGGGQPPPGWGPKGGRPSPGGGTIASQNRVPGGPQPLPGIPGGSGQRRPQPGDRLDIMPWEPGYPGGGMTPITGGGLQASPAAEQQANPMDIISRLLRQYQGGQRGQSMMGGKG